MPVFTAKDKMIGYGLVQPLRRISGSDFTAAGGSSLVKSGLNQILGTKLGDLPWRPDFGMDFERYRHVGSPDVPTDSLDETSAHSMGNMVAEGLPAWDPRIDVRECGVIKQGNAITCRVAWTVKVPLAGSNVLNNPYVTEIVV